MKSKLQSTLERVITYGLIIVCILVLIYFFGSANKRQRDEATRKASELASLDKQISQADIEYEKRVKQVGEITAQLNQKTQEVNEKFEKLLEKYDNYTFFIEQVQRKSKALDITIQNSTYETPTRSSGSKYLEFKFSATITGQYGKAKQFLWEVENAMGRLVKIGDLEIVPPIMDKLGNITFKLTLSTFFLP